MARLAVLGAGAWGTALALQAARAGQAVSLWARDPARAAAIAAAGENARYLPGVALPAGLTVTANLAKALQGAEAAILAVPAQHLRAFLAGLPGEAPPLVFAAKGVEQSSLLLPLEIVEAVRPGKPAAALSGPNFAREVAAGLPAAAVVASHDAGLRERIGDLLATPSFRLYGSDDPIGGRSGGRRRTSSPSPRAW